MENVERLESVESADNVGKERNGDPGPFLFDVPVERGDPVEPDVDVPDPDVDDPHSPDGPDVFDLSDGDDPERSRVDTEDHEERARIAERFGEGEIAG